jgi:hypothetical protein
MESLAAVAMVFAGLEGLVFTRFLKIPHFLMAINGLINPSLHFWIFLPKPK